MGPLYGTDSEKTPLLVAGRLDTSQNHDLSVSKSTDFQLELKSEEAEGWANKIDTQNGKPPQFKFSEMGGRQKLTLILCTTAITLSGIAFSLLGPFYPIEAGKKGMSATVIGLVIGVFEIVIFATSPFYGNYLTTLGPKFVYVAGIFVGGVCNILFGTLNMSPDGAPFVVMSVLCRSVEALGFSAFITASFAIVSAEFKDNIGLVFGILEMGSGLGYMIGPSVGGGLYELGGYGLPFYIAGCLTLINGILVYKFLPEVKNVTAKRKSSVFHLFRSGMVCIPLGSVFVGVLTMTSFGATMAQHLVPFGLNAAYIGLIFGIGALMYTMTSYIWGYISDTLDKQSPLIVGGHFVLALGFLLMGPSVLFPFIPYKLWAVSLGIISIGSSFGCTLIATMKCMVKGALELGFDNNIDTFSMVSGLFNSMHCLGAFVGPVGVGALVQEFDYPIAYTIVAFIDIFWMLVTLIFFSVHNAKRIAGNKSIIIR